MKQLRSVEQKRLHRSWQRRTDQRVALLLDGVQDPFNVGSIVRTAAALRVDHLYLSANATAPTHPKVGKTALGTERYLEWTQYERVASAAEAARTDGFVVVGLELADESVPFFELDLGGDVCIALGNESNGLNDAALASCDIVGYIPQLGRVGSLNVAAATAIALYEAGAPASLAGAMTAQLAHQNAGDVVAYKRAGWWGDTTVGDYVARWAREQPDADALVVGDTRLSWSEYDGRATRLATTLAATGLRRGARLAVLLPDGVAVHVTFVAAERAGLTVVGIGHRAGEAEIRHLLAKTGATAIVIQERDKARVPDDLGLDRVIVSADGDGETQAWGSDASALASRAFGADDLFLVNSTSGTTGLPKCVMHNQNRWMFFHQLAAAAGRFGTEDVFFSALPAPFGFGLWTSHVTPAVLGCTTVVQERFDADAALRAIERERVTVLGCVSTQFLMMLNSPELSQRDVSSLRCMFTGGEAVPYERASRFEDVTGARVLQFYGSNETGALSRTTIDDDREHRLSTAGRIIPEMHVRLLDDDGRDITEPGVPGNPVCKGPATCFGYLDDEQANHELFTSDGWMRIGDIAEIDAGGYLRVVGRTSDIIIRGGKNLSAPAIEAEVAEHPAIAVAAVVAMPDEVFGERVCLYAELRPDTSLELADVVEFLTERGVSREWFPEKLVVLDTLPRASGGKVAKGELRSWQGQGQ